MRTVTGFSIALLAVSGLWGQNQSGFINPSPTVTRGFGSVVFPGGTSALPGVQRTTGSVVYPGGGTPQIGIPGLSWQGMAGGNAARGIHRNGTAAYAYPVAVPVYVGGGYDNSMALPPAAPPQAQQPNVIVIYPPASPYPSYTYQPPAPPQSNLIEVPAAQTQPQAQEQTEATHYLLAFKDHSIYSAVAYWVDGDTLHYFPSGNAHHQVAVSLIDRELTRRLNEGSGMEVKLPAEK